MTTSATHYLLGGFYPIPQESYLLTVKQLNRFACKETVPFQKLIAYIKQPKAPLCAPLALQTLLIDYGLGTKECYPNNYVLAILKDLILQNESEEEKNLSSLSEDLKEKLHRICPPTPSSAPNTIRKIRSLFHSKSVPEIPEIPEKK